MTIVVYIQKTYNRIPQLLALFISIYVSFSAGFSADSAMWAAFRLGSNLNIGEFQ